MTQGSHDIGVHCVGAGRRNILRMVVSRGVQSAVPAFLAVVAILASYLPAHRATKVDPMIALREE